MWRKKSLVLAEYTFKIFLENWVRKIQVTCPPWITTADMSNIYSWCLDKYDEILVHNDKEWSQ